MYYFDEITDRRNTSSLKWDVGKDELPMWVADMDFKTAPCVIEAIKKRTENGVFGYSVVPREWNEAVAGWWERRHGYRPDENSIIFSTGVIPTISSAVRKLTTPNENVLIQTPVYNIFFNSIINNGCRPLENRLIYENGEYRIDFEDLEKKLSDPQTTLMILCNPHNPIGKIWDSETLSKIGNLCKKYHVTVISDEIHCDLTDPGKSYVPFASVSDVCREISITCVAPTKAFNIAGLQTSAVIVPDENLRHKVNRAINTDEVAEPNAFAIDAAIAAFNKGEEWLDELRIYIYDNKCYVRKFIEENIPEIHVTDSEATYLMWMDVSGLCDTGDFHVRLRKATGLYVSGGKQYGGESDNFIRINVACPMETVREGMKRLYEGVKMLRE